MSVRSPSFWIKVVLAAGLVALADPLFDAGHVGLPLGVFALAWCAALAVATPAVLRNRIGQAALGLAVLLAALQLERPTLIGWLMFGLVLGVAALSPRAGRGEDAWRWTQRLLFQGFAGLAGPLLDVRRLADPKIQARGPRFRSAVGVVVLPVVGGLAFLALFASANPLIERWLPSLRLPAIELPQVIFWGVVALAVWGILRPRFLRKPRPLAEAVGDLDLPGVSPLSITLSLVVFNAVFALQNGLDLAFLWSGAPLPAGMSHAEYAHRSAYPLVATALLAGLFVLVFLRPGSPTGESKLVRRLVVLWVAQNLLLVASTALRTIAYVEAYSLTVLRIAALLWMGLVAVGLALICWRLLARKSASWLVNANVLAAGLVLGACSVVDLSAVAAHWNVRHARELGGPGAPLDVGYLAGLDDAALVALTELKARPLPADLRTEVDRLHADQLHRLLRRQEDWRTWTWRGARRLARIEALQPRPTLPLAPLTAPPQPRT
ncbi:DUF4153 domain-containing protein [Phenylobacterium sp. J367]|uniref:DUF4153 domain-containing protein n=1 Tax=Phenylobacterium sp. J367 TaxID=2898435 RepID=UPI00215070D9|nr:DUF4173 domain-containing protein [Phenylobacterium sp. J367]MCR5880576.1 DUF4173 domain-containing protein [Phenylobacterium sp. J367]